jgi:hypothetical protein
VASTHFYQICSLHYLYAKWYCKYSVIDNTWRKKVNCVGSLADFQKNEYVKNSKKSEMTASIIPFYDFMSVWFGTTIL